MHFRKFEQHGRLGETYAHTEVMLPVLEVDCISIRRPYNSGNY